MKYKNVYFSLKIKKVVPVSEADSSVPSDADPQALPFFRPCRLQHRLMHLEPEGEKRIARMAVGKATAELGLKEIPHSPDKPTAPELMRPNQATKMVCGCSLVVCPSEKERRGSDPARRKPHRRARTHTLPIAQIGKTLLSICYVSFQT